MLPKFDLTDPRVSLSVLEDVTTNVKQIQDSILEAILSRNAHTEYLRGFLKGQVDMHSFKKNVPVVTYEDIKSYIDRLANGEPSDLICDRPISVLASSSGTSGGVPKLFPLTTEELEQRLSFGSLYRPLLQKHLEGISEGKSLIFYFVARDSLTASGILVRSMLTCFLKRSNELIWEQSQVSPHGITICADTSQSMYCQLLCGLLQRDNVGCLGAPFASSFLRVIKFLEDHWAEICSNIRKGRLSDWITDDQCVSGISRFLTTPNPELASLIEQECSKTSWEAILRRLWPKATIIDAVVTGTMAQYVPLLDFYSGGLPVISSYYCSSECFFGFNTNPLCKPSDVSYTIIPSMGYFEFLEVKKEHQETGHHPVDNPVVVDLVDVKVGHDYEPVVTTFSGLYRYRVGDVLRATGFHNNTPHFRFLGRLKVVLSIDTEKTYEEDLISAVTKAKLLLEPHDLMLMDFTSRVDSSKFPGHYVLYWELESKLKDAELKPDPNVLEECCFTIEESLDASYRRTRKSDNIGPLEIKVVKPGAFDELMNFFVSRGSSVSQYKTPSSVTNAEAFKILDANVISEFFSRKTPSWELHELHSGR